jgi:hypothetical protein
MADSSHDSHAPSGPLPTVHDEAADTPTWLPVVGLVLFGLMLLWMLTRADEPAAVGPAAEAPAIEAAPDAE